MSGNPSTETVQSRTSENRHFAWNAGVENKDDKDVRKGPIYVKGESIDPKPGPWTCDFHALARTLQ